MSELTKLLGLDWIGNQTGINPDLGQSDLIRTLLRGSGGQIGMPGESASPITTTAEQGQVDTDIQALLDRILAERKGLYESTEAKGGDFLSKMTGERKQRLTDLEALLSGSMERQFSENTPGILEGLSSRGLLHSSGVGEELAKEKGRLGSIASEQLQAQGLADLDVEQKLAQDIQDRLFGIQSGDVSTSTDLWTSGLQRKYSLQDLEKTLALAEKTGTMNKQSSDTQSLMDLIGKLAPLLALA